MVITWCRLPVRCYGVVELLLDRHSAQWDFQVYVFTPDQRGDGNGRPLLPSLVQHSMRNLLL